MRYVITFCAIGLASTPCAAKQRYWSEIQICQAAVASYFFLEKIPSYVGEQQDSHSLTLDHRRFYLCRASNGRAIIAWKEAGVYEQSKPVLYALKLNKLMMGTEMGLRAFELDGGEVHCGPDI